MIVCRLCDSFFHLSLIRVDALSVLGTIFLQIVSAGDAILYYILKVSGTLRLLVRDSTPAEALCCVLGQDMLSAA